MLNNATQPTGTRNPEFCFEHTNAGVAAHHSWHFRSFREIHLSGQMLAKRGRRALFMCMFPPSTCLHVPPPPPNRLRSSVPRNPKFVEVVAAATAAALFLSHHAADAFFGPARPSFVGGSAPAAGAPSTSSAMAASAAAGVASTEDGVQRRHFYGFGDPDHVPSILQNITAQRYIGEEGDGARECGDRQ